MNTQIETDPDELLTPKEAAAILKVNVKTVYKLLKSGEIPCRRFGDNSRIRRGDLTEKPKSQEEK